MDIGLPSGVWGVLPTPFTDDTDRVDHHALVRAVELYGEVSAVGVVALGVFGEAAHLTDPEREALIATVATSAGPLGVVAGITQLDTDAACHEARRLIEAASHRLTAVMVHVNTTDPARLATHLSQLHQACGLPIVIQDYPAATGVRIRAHKLAHAVNAVASVAAVKCESPPTSAAIATLSARVTVPVFGGLGGIGLLDELQAGAAGAMTGFSHPEALVSTVNAWQTHGFLAARRALEPWLPLINFEAQPDIGLALRKEHFRRRGIFDSAAVRPPAHPLPAHLAEHIELHLSHRPSDHTQTR